MQYLERQRLSTASALLIFVALASTAFGVGCLGEADPVIEPARQAIINGSRARGDRGVVAVQRRDWTTGVGGLCSGSVIGPYAVLTAKHCVYMESTRVAPSELVVVVGHNLRSAGGVESGRGVLEIRTTPGNDIPRDLNNGNDIAILLLDGPIDAPILPTSTTAPSRRDPLTIIGFGRTMTGGGAPDDSGVKYKGTAQVESVAGNVFETSGVSAACEGDSGGPAINTTRGDVVGIASFVLDTRCNRGQAFYTRVDAHAALIADALLYEPVCEPSAEICDGEDNDCNGVVDEGCVGLGAACTDDAECARGTCGDVDGERVCVRDCDPRDAVPACPLGFYCEELSCGVGRCIGAAAGPSPDGTECSVDGDCASLNCGDVAGTMRCGRSCGIDSDPCTGGNVCEGAAGGGCGSCIPVELSTGPRIFGSPCDTAEQCIDGICEDGFCTRPCPPACPGGFHCREALCRLGELGGPGASCVTSEDCASSAPDCANADGDLVCAAGCDESGLCGPGLECGPTDLGDRCVTPGLALGETCMTQESCRTGICNGVCTRVCTEMDPCPSGFECRPAGEVSGCFVPRDAPPRDTRDTGGCSAIALGDAAPITSLFFLAALLFFRQRRR